MHHFLPSLFCYLLHILFSFAYIIDIFICIRGSGLLSAAVFYQEKKPFLIKLGGFYIKGKTTSANKTASTFADEGTSNLILISLAFILLSFFLNVSLIFFTVSLKSITYFLVSLAHILFCGFVTCTNTVVFFRGVIVAYFCFFYHHPVHCIFSIIITIFIHCIFCIFCYGTYFIILERFFGILSLFPFFALFCSVIFCYTIHLTIHNCNNFVILLRVGEGSTYGSLVFCLPFQVFRGVSARNDNKIPLNNMFSGDYLNSNSRRGLQLAIGFIFRSEGLHFQIFGNFSKNQVQHFLCSINCHYFNSTLM